MTSTQYSVLVLPLIFHPLLYILFVEDKEEEGGVAIAGDKQAHGEKASMEELAPVKVAYAKAATEKDVKVAVEEDLTRGY